MSDDNSTSLTRPRQPNVWDRIWAFLQLFDAEDPWESLERRITRLERIIHRDAKTTDPIGDALRDT